MSEEFLAVNDLQATLLSEYKPAKIYRYKRDGDICVWYCKKKPLKGGEKHE